MADFLWTERSKRTIIRLKEKRVFIFKKGLSFFFATNNIAGKRILPQRRNCHLFFTSSWMIKANPRRTTSELSRLPRKGTVFNYPSQFYGAKVEGETSAPWDAKLANPKIKISQRGFHISPGYFLFTSFPFFVFFPFLLLPPRVVHSAVYYPSYLFIIT